MEEFGRIMNSIFVILMFTATSVTSKKEALTLHFYSRESPTGVILSRGYPYSYNLSEVEHFYFHGEENENVQIVFEDFNLYRKSTNQSGDISRCGTESAYISYRKTEKGDLEKLCGNKKLLPIMSESNVFHLQYNPIMVPANDPVRERNDVIGFNATFRFLTNYGIDSGRQQEDRCVFHYYSNVTQNGTLNSPNFPGTYPTASTCYYIFFNSEKYLVIDFTHFNLIGSSECDDVKRGKKDYIQISVSSDGSDKDSMIFCGNHTEPFSVKLQNQTVFMAYYHKYTNFSDYDLSEYGFVGFNASFQFTNEITDSSDHNLPDIFIVFISVYLSSKQLNF